ncbi:UDP-N-acetylglucosamine 2-epimerase (non-hydrolyzing) [Candidatus Woesearchaeota archaeon]|nr:UDP-N-acetylglucosamine 2-epimerase (non-hydrolyzing) [Candidatus Woesearchaeota archaeon]
MTLENNNNNNNIKQKLKIITVAGARPNFMKVAPFLKALDKFNDSSNDIVITSLFAHTGQHYDVNMSDVFFKNLQIKQPEYHLGIGGAAAGSIVEQTAKIMTEFEKVLVTEKPDLVVVVGDVTSTISCALTSVRYGVKAAHIEAGLRSFDRTMPEEINRILTDKIADFLFVTEESGVKHLKNEGVSEDKIFLVGNLMIDSLVQFKEIALKSTILHDLGLEKGKYIAATLHRPSSVDDKRTFANLLDAFEEIQKKMKIVLPLHPRSKKKLQDFGLQSKIEKMQNLLIIEPVGYFDFLKLMMDAKLVITDSGGIQEETTFLGIPCITTRNNTERPVTIELGTNVLVGLDKNKIIDETLKVLSGNAKKGIAPPLWDGNAAERVVKIIVEKLMIS